MCIFQLETITTMILILRLTHHILALLVLNQVVSSYNNCKPTSPLEFQPATPLELAQHLVGTGVTIVDGSVKFLGSHGTTASQMAKFSGGATIFQNEDDMDTGIVLTTGNVNQPLCKPQGNIDSKQWPGNTDPIDTDLVKICKEFYAAKGLGSNDCNTYQDQAVLSFRFIVKTRATMGIKYSFASEEWPDYVEDLYSDGFAFFIDSENIALTPQGQGVSVGSINCQQCSKSHCCDNCDLYVNNGGGVSCPGAVASAPNEQKYTYNAYTKVLRGEKILAAGEHTIKMVIADMKDGLYDSSVFIAAKSLVATNPMCYSVTVSFHKEHIPDAKLDIHVS